MSKKLSMNVNMKFQNHGKGDHNDDDLLKGSPKQMSQVSKYSQNKSAKAEKIVQQNLKLQKIQQNAKENSTLRQPTCSSPFKLRLSVNANQNERFDSKLSWFDNTDNLVGD